MNFEQPTESQEAGVVKLSREEFDKIRKMNVNDPRLAKWLEEHGVKFDSEMMLEINGERKKINNPELVRWLQERGIELDSEMMIRVDGVRERISTSRKDFGTIIDEVE